MPKKMTMTIKIIVSALLLDLEKAVERPVWVAPGALITQLDALIRKAEGEARVMVWQAAYGGLNDTTAGVYVKIFVGNDLVYTGEVSAKIEKDVGKIRKTDEEIVEQISSFFNKAKEPLALKIISSSEFRSQKVS